MENAIGILIGAAVVILILTVLFEFRVRKPDVLLLYETKGQIKIRKGLIYPRHFSLPLERTTSPIQLTVEAAVVGNLEVRIKLVGSIAPSLEHIHSLIRIGGWNNEAVAHVAEEVQVMLQGLVKEYVEQCEIHALSSTEILNYLNERSSLIQEKFGVELITLTVQALESTDPEISEAGVGPGRQHVGVFGGDQFIFPGHCGTPFRRSARGRSPAWCRRERSPRPAPRRPCWRRPP